jgi:hypothetical protein
MPFTSAQKDTIRKLLCCPKRFLDSALLPYPYNYPLAERILVVESDADTTALLVQTLTEVAAIDAQITELMDLSYVSDVEGIKINPGAGIMRLRMQGMTKIRIISDALDLKPMGNYYSPPSTIASSRWV